MKQASNGANSTFQLWWTTLFDMWWFMIFTDRCPLPSLGGEDLPKRHSPSLLYFTKEIPNTQPTKKQLKRRWGHYYFLSLPLAAIFWQLPMQVLMSQMLSKRLEVNDTYCCIANKADLFYMVSLLELISRTSNLFPNSKNLYLQLQVARDLDTLQLNGVSPKRKRR